MNREDFTEFSGGLTADVLEFHPDAIPTPDTLYIRMTRGERRIVDELRKESGGFERVIIDVDAEQHEFNADSFIGLLESYEGASRWHELFGSPERAARTMMRMCDVRRMGCGECPLYETEIDDCDDYDALLEWLNGERCVHHG